MMATDGLVIAHAHLQALATLVWKVARDIRLLGSGPRAGFGEINLPAVAPGSSIMPGKVNPVIPEMVFLSTDRVCANHAVWFQAFYPAGLSLEHLPVFRLRASLKVPI